MGTISDQFMQVYRDFATDGVAASGLNDPEKADIRALGALIELAIGRAGLGSTLSVIYATRAELDADLAHAVGTVALVFADASETNNDLYVKVGASGSGSWTLTTALHDTTASIALRASNSVPFGSWSALAATAGMEDGDRATVSVSDAGTHTDPVVGGTVGNAGLYQYSASPAGWQRVGDLDSQTANAAAVSIRSQNLIADPWMRELNKNHHQANGTSAAYLGTLTVPDTASPVNAGGSVSATGTSQARRIVPLPDNVAIGDQITAMGVCSATGASQFTLTFLDSAFATISSVNASGTFTGTAVSQSVTTTVPATTAYLQYGLSSAGSSTKTLYGTFLGKGVATPGRTEADSYIYPIAPLNKYPDHLCGLSGLGVVQVDTYPLLGANVAGAAIETAPAESPFGGKAILLPSGAAAHDLKIAANRLGLEPGKPIFVNVGYVYAGQVTTTIGFYDSTDTLIGSAKTVFIDCRNPVTLVKEYGELRTEMPVDATTAATATYLKIRSFSGGAATSDCHLIGVSVASRPHYISAAQPVLAAGNPTTRSAIPARVLGKKIVIFGDSVLGNSINVDTGPNHNWRADNYIAEEIGANVFNFAIGGTTYAGRVSTDYDPFSMSALADAMVSGDWSAQSAVVGHLEAIDATRLAGMMAMDWTTVDAILCQHGTNDYGAEQKAIGSNSDTTRATFKGAINNTIKQVLYAAPQARLMLFTPLWREEFLDSFAGNVSIAGTTLTVNSVATTGLTAGNSILARGITRRTTILSQTSGTAGGVGTYTIDQPWTVTAVSGFGYDPTTNGRDHANSQGKTLPDYVQAIKDIAALHNIPVVDLYQGLGFGPDNASVWCNDGLHPNGWWGMPLLARFTARALANYV